MAQVLVRRVSEGEWELLRNLRLAALSADPEAFLSTADAERGDPSDVWRLRTHFRAVAWLDGNPVGLIGWARHDGYLEIVGLWVHPERRGGHIASQLTSFVLDHIRVDGEEVRLAVIATNERARRFYERVGFDLTHTEQHATAGELVWMGCHREPGGK